MLLDYDVCDTFFMSMIIILIIKKVTIYCLLNRENMSYNENLLDFIFLYLLSLQI